MRIRGRLYSSLMSIFLRKRWKTCGVSVLTFQGSLILGSLESLGRIGELIIAMLRSGNDLDGLNVPNFAMLVYSSYRSIFFRNRANAETQKRDCHANDHAHLSKIFD